MLSTQRLKAQLLYLAELLLHSKAGCIPNKGTNRRGQKGIDNQRRALNNSLARDLLNAPYQRTDNSHPRDTKRDVQTFERPILERSPFLVEIPRYRKGLLWVLVGEAILKNSAGECIQFDLSNAKSGHSSSVAGTYNDALSKSELHNSIKDSPKAFVIGGNR